MLCACVLAVPGCAAVDGDGEATGRTGGGETGERSGDTSGERPGAQAGGQPGDPQQRGQSPAEAGSEHGARDAAARPEERAADPVRLRLPSLGVNAAVDPLKVNAERELGTPNDPAHTGWWRAGPEPGEEGPAVVVGHYDSDTGPAVFHHLERLDSGDPVRVQRADGSIATFRVRAVQSHPQDDFPTERVYGDTDGRAALRLITCGGAYDREAERYEENVVVYATLDGVQQRDDGGS